MSVGSDGRSCSSLRIPQNRWSSSHALSSTAGPSTPYYGGAYDKVEPHLSLGFGTAKVLEPIAAAVEAYTPISVTVTEVTLLVGPPDRMIAGQSFRLGR